MQSGEHQREKRAATTMTTPLRSRLQLPLPPGSSSRFDTTRQRQDSTIPRLRTTTGGGFSLPLPPPSPNITPQGKSRTIVKQQENPPSSPFHTAEEQQPFTAAPPTPPRPSKQSDAFTTPVAHYHHKSDGHLREITDPVEKMNLDGTAVVDVKEESVLPRGWVKVIDSASNTPYYLYEPDGTTTWKRPGAEGESDDPDGAVTNEDSVTGSEIAPRERNKFHAVPSLPDGWMELIDEASGIPYYLNQVDGSTTWDKPGFGSPTVDTVSEHAVEPANYQNGGATTVEAAPNSELPEGWVKIIHETSGIPYFMFALDGTTTWDRPTVAVELVDSLTEEVEKQLDENTEPAIPLQEDPMGSAEVATVQDEPLSDTSLAALQEGWVEMIDEASGTPYYFFEPHGTTTWERPGVVNAASQKDESTSEQVAAKDNMLQPSTLHEESEEDAVTQIQEGRPAGPQSSASGVLPESWIEMTDDGSGATYYLFKPDGTTSWDRPEPSALETEGIVLRESEQPEEEPQVLDDVQIDEGEPERVTFEPLPDGWVEMIDASSGETCYLFEPNGTTAWKRPSLLEPASQEPEYEQEFDAADGTVPEAEISVELEEAHLPDGWVEMVDDASGMPYFCFIADGTTTWERPTEEIGSVGEFAPMQEPADLKPVSQESAEAGNAGEDDTAHECGANTEPSGDSLPGCVDMVDEASDTPYFLEANGTTSWEQPKVSHHLIEARFTDEPIEQKTELVLENVISTNTEHLSVSQEIVNENLVSTPEGLQAGWVEMIDESSGEPYFLFEPDGTTTWERPIIQACVQGKSPTPEAQMQETLVEDIADASVKEAGSDNEEKQYHHLMDASPFGSVEMAIEDSGCYREDDTTSRERPMQESEAISPVKQAMSDVLEHNSLPKDETTVQTVEEALPNGWVEVVVEASSVPYYIFQPDGTSTWEKPRKVAPVELDVLETEELQSAHDKAILEAQPPNAELPAGWVELVDDASGTPYYLFEADGTSTWDKPVFEPVLGHFTTHRAADIIKSELKLETVDSNEDVCPTRTYIEDSGHLPSMSLPDGWVELIDETSGMSYFLFEANGTTTWERPGTVSNDSVDPDQVEADVTEPVAFQAEDNATLVADTSIGALPDGWVEITDEDSGALFYRFELDGTTSFQRPTAAELQKSQVSEPKQGDEVKKIFVNDTLNPETSLQLPGGWVELIDETSGETYFLYEPDGTRTWERPTINSCVVPETEPANPGLEDPVLTDVVAETLESDDTADRKSSTRMPSHDLAEGWVEMIDETSNVPYYVYEQDGTTTWDRPTDPKLNSPIANCPVLEASRDEIVLDQHEEPAETKTSNDELLPVGWSKIIGESSDIPYYFNKQQGTASWERPPLLTPAPPNGDGFTYSNVADSVATPETGSIENNFCDDAEKLPSGWTELVDERSGQVYYLHSTGTTSWDRPGINHEDTPADKDANRFVAVEAGDGLSKTQDYSASKLTDKSPEIIVPDESEDGAFAPKESTVTEALDLLVGWSAHIDPASGMTYYLHEVDDTTTWDRPASSTAAKVESNLSPRAEHQDDHGTEGESSYVMVELASEDGRNLLQEREGSNDLPLGWEEVIDEVSGTPYYFHESEGLTSWERPVFEPRTGEEMDQYAASRESAPEETGHEADDVFNASAAKPFAAKSLIQTESHHLKPKQLPLAAGVVEAVDPGFGSTYLNTDDNDSTTQGLPLRSSNLPIKFKARQPGRKAHPSATFGFGGRLCIVIPDLASNQVCVKTMSATLCRDAVLLSELFKRKCGLIGPLIQSSNVAVQFYVDRKSALGVDLLWSLVSLASKSKGKLRSSRGVADPTTPQARIVERLLQDYEETRSQSFGTESEALREYNSEASSGMQNVERYLLRGEREKAVKEAIDSGNFALALLVATMCSYDVYQHTAKCFTDHVLSKSQPLHTIALLLSGQLESANSENGSNSLWDRINPDALKKTWKSHLAAIMSNPASGWELIVLALGDRLVELGDVPGAHYCYMVCGCSVGNPLDPEARLTLLGSVMGPQELLLGSPAAVESFGRTEAYEWAKRQGNPNVSIRSLQNLKFRYAMMLSDLGLVHESKLYMESIFECLGFRDSHISSANGQEFPISRAILSSDKKYLLPALLDFYSRLRGNASIETTSPRSKAGESPAQENVDENDVSFVTARTTFHDNSAEPDSLLSPKQDADGIERHSPAPQSPARDSLLRTIGSDNVPFIPGNSKSNAASIKSDPKATKAPPPAVTTVLESENDAVSPGFQTPKANTATVSASKDEKPTRPETAPMSAPAHLESTKKDSPKSKLHRWRSAVVLQMLFCNKLSKIAFLHFCRRFAEKGIFDFGIKESVTKWLNPNAKRADLGDEMKAYHDAVRGVWVFPGENPDEVAKPIGAPPTASTPIATAPAPAPSDDPLAAMMAPPQRNPSALRKPQPSPMSMPIMMFPPGISPPTQMTPGAISPKIAVFTPSPIDTANGEQKEQE
jgi:Sec23-binding domain of Sec16/WW domain